MFKLKPSYTYSDIGIKPIYLSNTKSRTEVNTSTRFLSIPISLPVIAAPMVKVVGVEMAIAMYELGGLAILPRTDDIYTDNKNLNSLYDIDKNAIPSIPLKNKSGEIGWSGRIMDSTKIVCIDIANAFNSNIEETVKSLRDHRPDIKIITGNVASVEGYKYLAELGINAVRVGIGGGSVCRTSIATGIGVGQASIIREIANFRYLDCTYPERMPEIIADGGIKTPGDLCKAIALGADVVMIGGLLAGAKESPGEVIIHEGKKYKHMAGQASMHIKGQKSFVEGEDLLVPYKGPVKEIWTGLSEGLKSAMAYMGYDYLDDFRYLPDECFVQLGIGARHERGIHANTFS